MEFSIGEKALAINSERGHAGRVVVIDSARQYWESEHYYSKVKRDFHGYWVTLGGNRLVCPEQWLMRLPPELAEKKLADAVVA